MLNKGPRMSGTSSQSFSGPSPSRVLRDRRGRLRAAAQRGFTLIELAVASVVAVVLAAIASKALIDEMQEGLSEATSSYLFTLKSSMDDFTTKNVTEIANSLPVTGFADPLAPTLPELKAAGHLTSAFPSTTPFGQTVTLSVTRSAACPGPGCLITSYVYTNSPINAVGGNNSYLTTVVRNGVGGYAIGSTDLDPGQLVGLQCDPYPNPLGAVPYVVGACSVLNAGYWAQFVRRGDDRVTTLNNSLHVNGTVTASLAIVTGTIASLTGNVGAGTGSSGCRLSELLASGQIVSRTMDCVTRAIVDSDPAEGGRVKLRNASDQQTVQLKGTGGEITAGNGAATTVTIDGATGRIGTNGYAPGAMPSGWGGGVATEDVAARGSVGAWDGTNLRASMDKDGNIVARSAAGVGTVTLDGTNGKASAETLLATASATIGAACVTVGDQRQRADAPGAYATCQGGVWTPLGARMVASNSACTVAGEYAIDSSGQAMVCKQTGGGPGGYFVAAKHLMSDFVFLASSLVTDGSVVPKPVCATVGGAAGIALIFVIGQTEGSNDGAFNRYAVDNGPSWTVYLKKGDDSTSLSGGSALAQQYCYYAS